MRSRWVFGLLSLLTLDSPVVLQAQDPRCEQVSLAREEFDPAKRRQMRPGVVNPAVGPPRDCWALGIQALAQTLVEEEQDSAAGIWLRWAIRLSTDLQPDTVQFLPRMVTVFRAAQQYVSLTRTSGDAITRTTWLWPVRGAAEGPGRILIDTSTAIPLQVSVDGVGLLGPGATAQVAPGSHQVRAAASGYDSVRVTREVLPGVTTLLSFALHPLQVAGRQQGAQQPQQQPIEPGHHGRFPWVWAALGAAGAGVAIAVLAGGKGSGGTPTPTTGGIIISFPNP